MSDDERISATTLGVDHLRPLAPEEAQERKERVLTQGVPSLVRSIAGAVVVKDDELFFLTTPEGHVPLDEGHGFGLYYHDCRFLNGYTLTLADTAPSALASEAAQGHRAVFQLTNPDLRMASGQLIPKESVGIKWEHVIDSARLALSNVLTFQNFGLSLVEFPAQLTFRAEFEPIFHVRELIPEHPGQIREPAGRDGTLRFRYDGADGFHRSLTVEFAPDPEAMEGTKARFRVRLQPREVKQIRIALRVAEAKSLQGVTPNGRYRHDHSHVAATLERSCVEWLTDQTLIRSDSLLLNQMVERSLRALHVLRTCLGNRTFFAAGVPWFATLFGRDSVLTALQTLAFQPRSAADTLRLLARFQGRRVDDWRDEQPGKILHEYRVDELSRMDRIPYHPPYSGTADATSLFLILVERHAAWTGTLEVFYELRGNVERALEWMDRYGDANGDGYIEYESVSREGLINQGWKDAGDAIVNADGSLAKPPISLVEVQGYAYRAKLAIADLFRRTGEPERANRLRQEAEELRIRFNRDFWLEDLGFYALALQADDRPAAVISSNPGHALWSGIVDWDKAQRTVERLMAEDMFSGWGIRTLSEKEFRYNPLGYHLGTVWPHDNAILVAGFRRYGFDEAAKRVFHAIVDAAMHYDYYELPELFAGYARTDYSRPVRYPVACHPHAWSSGSLPYLLEVMLGLTPEALDGRLRIVRPILPTFINHLEVRGLRVGEARVDLGFERTTRGVAVEVFRVDGPLDVTVQVATEAGSVVEEGQDE